MLEYRQDETRKSTAPRVSVIVPNYNHANFLPKRLDSVLAQTFQEYELLILDDRSSDESIEVIRPYLVDPRARLEINEKNSGSPYRQWRKGLSLARGQYIWIAESDDFADPAFLETMVAALDGDPASGIASCLSYEINAEGHVLNRYFDEWVGGNGPFSVYGPFPFEQPILMNGREYCGRYMTPFNTLPNASGILFRRSALEAIGGPVDSMKICGDWFTYCKILMNWDIVIRPELFNYFRTHTTNVRKQTKSIDFIREAQEVCTFLRRHLNQQPSAAARKTERTLYAQMLLGSERTYKDKVPMRRIPAVISRAVPLGMVMTAWTTHLLAQEVASGCWKKLRGEKARAS